MRRSKKPSKQLLWLWMDKLYTKSVNYNIGLDVACGSMDMRKYFKTKKYIGIDLDEERINIGVKNNPGVQGIVKSIELMDENDKGDFVTCLQTIGINKHFNTEYTILCVSKLIQATNVDGMLIFNIGPFSYRYFDTIYTMLLTYYSNIEVRKYGRFGNEVNSHLAYLIAKLMNKYPNLMFCEKKPYVFFYAQNKIIT
jgi:hypothetical protein